MIFLFGRVHSIRLLMPVIATAAYKSHADLLKVATSEESSYSTGKHYMPSVLRGEFRKPITMSKMCVLSKHSARQYYASVFPL
jgi:hypothetical protein